MIPAFHIEGRKWWIDRTGDAVARDDIQDPTTTHSLALTLCTGDDLNFNTTSCLRYAIKLRRMGGPPTMLADRFSKGVPGGTYYMLFEDVSES
jgi:hypothetical protein